MTGLPPGWSEAPFGDLITKIGNGAFVSRPGIEPNGVPILRVSALRPLSLNLNDLRYTGLSVDDVKIKRALLSPDDLLFSRLNGNPDYVGVCAAVPRGIGNVAFSDKQIRVSVRTDVVVPKFIAFAFSSPIIRAAVRSSVRTTAGQASVAGPDISRVVIPIPPLGEQQRIVAALEEHISRSQKADSILTTLTYRSKVFENSLVDRALRAQCVDAIPSEGTGGELLKNILDKRSEFISRRQRETLEPAMNFSISVPDRWMVVSVDQLAWSIEYGTSAKTSPMEQDDDVPIIRMGNIQNGAVMLDKLKYLSADHDDVKKLLLSDGDLLFNRTNSAELVGKCAVYRDSLGPASFASYLIRCRFIDGVEPDWVATVINSSLGRSYIRSVMNQQVGQANVNGTKLAAMPIPLPPHGEQRRILASLDSQRVASRRLGDAVQTALQMGQSLRRGLLREAFSGRLVPQDPTDEPASELLARIRAERAAQPKPQRARRTKPKESPAASPAESPAASRTEWPDSTRTPTTYEQGELL
ncbi:restriction endonuclease subunit S [Streptosporangium canum]|uniref:restriction endonuclease subunit S n=1 Tax=Streptosporangium canum TaxID=324952 RepID=UPI003449CEBE